MDLKDLRLLHFINVIGETFGRAFLRGVRHELHLLPTIGVSGTIAPKRGRPASMHKRRCSIIGCKGFSRTKGFCAAHYQKLRLLQKTNRKPATWVDNAPPNSIPDVKLPRGRAGAKALKEMGR